MAANQVPPPAGLSISNRPPSAVTRRHHCADAGREAAARENFREDPVGQFAQLGVAVLAWVGDLLDSGRMAKRLDYWLAQPVT